MDRSAISAVLIPTRSNRAAAPRVRASWADVGCSRFCALLVGIMLAALVADVVLFAITGLRIASDIAGGFALVGVVGTFWACMVWLPGTPREWIIPQAAMVLILLQTSGLIFTPMTYASTALNRPTIDPWLAQADAWMGVSVPAIVAWTGGHPWLVSILRWSYGTLVLQLFVPVFALPFVNDREALWEYAFHMMVCSVITTAVFGLWPAACVFTELHFTSLLNQDRFVTQFNALRAGTLTVVQFSNIEGLVSCPSFHVGGAAMVTWACRRTWLVWPLLVVNVLLTVSTVFLGAHYAVDLIASAIMLAVSLALYRGVSRVLPP